MTRTRRRKKRMLLNHDFALWCGMMVCLVAGVFSGFLFCRMGFDSFSSGLIQLSPAADDDCSFISAFASCVRFPLLLFVFSHSRFSSPLILFTLFGRGFLLSYSVALYGGYYGIIGVLCGIFLNLFSCLILLPLQFLIAGWGIARERREADRSSMKIALAIVIICFLCAIPEYYLTPCIFELLSQFF